MISWIKGQLVSSWQSNNKFYILINCRGLGYEVQTLESVIIDINQNKISEKEIILWLKRRFRSVFWFHIERSKRFFQSNVKH